MLLCEEELDQALQAHLVLWIKVLLKRKIRPKTILVDLVKDCLIKLVLATLLDSLS